VNIATPSRRRGERTVEVSEEVVRVLDAEAQAHEGLGIEFPPPITPIFAR